MSLLSYYLEYGRHLARHRRGRHHEYVPTNNNASHNNQEKTNSWVSLLSYMGMGLPLAAICTAGAPL